MPIGNSNERKAIEIGFYHPRFSLTVQRRHRMRLRPAVLEPGGDPRVSSRAALAATRDERSRHEDPDWAVWVLSRRK